MRKPQIAAVLVTAVCVLPVALRSGTGSSRSIAAQVEGVKLIVTTPSGDKCFCASQADTETERQSGLSPDGDPTPFDAMLFTWTAAVTPSFWMKDTDKSLDVAFVSHDGTVAEVLNMPPCTATPCPAYRSPVPTKLAVEAPALERMGIVKGVRVRVAEPCKVNTDE